MIPLRFRIACLLAMSMACQYLAAADVLSVRHSPQQPKSGQEVTVVARVEASAVQSMQLQYQIVEPGAYVELADKAYKLNWIPVPMAFETNAQGAMFTVKLPATLQLNRRLIRYRLSGTNAIGKAVVFPALEEPEPNFAYFVYDGIPAWRGAIEPQSWDPRRRVLTFFDTNAMSQVQSYHLLGKKASVENATWNEQSSGKDYKYTGTFVADGVVYDHIRFRARGGVWRYAMAKNMWKIDFNKGHALAARDDYGHLYDVKWSKLNLRSIIQQATFGYRGEQGMFESVGFRLFNMAGVPAPRTHWIEFRIVDESLENPADQFRGDFWGLYLAIENEDGKFVEEHHLEDGNLFKMEGGTGTLNHAGQGCVTNLADLRDFMVNMRQPRTPDSWWTSHFDMPELYSYRTIVEAIHHYDIEQGKNYDYFHACKSDKWTVVPWDIDLTWSQNMYGGGVDPFIQSQVFTRPAFKREYQNRIRELRDLLFNPDQTGKLIDECAAIVSRPDGKGIVAADRIKWDYHPRMLSGYSDKAGQGRFYTISPTHDFAGMVELMKRYIVERGTWMDQTLGAAPRIPQTPQISSAGPGFPRKNLSFKTTPFRGSTEFASLKWRIGEVAPPKTSGIVREPGKYEIMPVWESGEIKDTSKLETTIPEASLVAGHRYRARVRMKDAAGVWSHWSAPLEFTAAE